MEKDYTIIPTFCGYSAVVIQTSNKDPIFNLKDIERDLFSLGIYGKILFDRLLTTGYADDRFSYNYFFLGKFDNNALVVVSNKRDREEYSRGLSMFYDNIRSKVKRLYNIEI